MMDVLNIHIAPVLALIFAACIWIGWRTYRSKKISHSEIRRGISRLYNDIRPLENFQWDSEQPVLIKPFKSSFHLTMALQSCSFSDLVAVDKTYRDKIILRRQLIETETDNVIECNQVATDAVHELYEWIFNIYLPKRFPSMFTILDPESTRGSKGGWLHNKVFDDLIPLDPPIDPTECLKILGNHVDDEFLILLPTADSNAAPLCATPTLEPTCPYHLHAYVLCFPSGFNTPKKFGLPLAAIHAPVPGYSLKLEKSMDRFFATIPFGKIVRRVNWALQTDSQFFKLDGNHLSTTLSPSAMAPPTHEPTVEELASWDDAAKRVDPEECNLRCERQTLHRLERTGALIFAFKTYLYPLPEVKAKGLGPEMSDAVEGLWKGSVPAMAVYKRGVVWGKKVVAFLRS